MLSVISPFLHDLCICIILLKFDYNLNWQCSSIQSNSVILKKNEKIGFSGTHRNNIICGSVGA